MRTITTLITAVALLALPTAALAEPTCTEQLGPPPTASTSCTTTSSAWGATATSPGPQPAGSWGRSCAPRAERWSPALPGPCHMSNGFAPGASFCTDSASPGAHL
jgi:hypothetical protein